MKTTFETTQEIIEKGNKKEMFNLFYNPMGDLNAENLVDFIKACSNTFCKDIACKFENGLSEKQSWCLVYEIEKIKHLYAAWVESELKKL